ncbi:PepSY domain-containing protein [Amphritea sp. HPY]|uniref:PepSY domain-containing protein n=1 Tax=Amphritea sp. HPY TaxID=3421652 RepID=UPI003D7E2F54
MLKALLKLVRPMGFFMLIIGASQASSVASAELNTSLFTSPLVLAEAGISLQSAASKARAKHGGKVVKAETVSKGGHQIHQIRLVKEGRVKTVRIDATTGIEIAR